MRLAHRDRTRGSVLVEFTLSATFFVALFLGVWQFGYGFYIYGEVNIPLTTYKKDCMLLGQAPEAKQLSVIEFLCGDLAFLWQEWPMPMTVTTLNVDEHRFSFNGVCPHCGRAACFMIVAGPYIEEADLGIGTGYKYVAAMQCQGCRGHILGLATRIHNVPRFQYLIHYPLGKPNDSVDPNVPEQVRSSFSEALRCRWIKAFQATVLMCRRSLQISCDMEDAKGKDLFSQIDDLAKRGRITGPLRNMAQRIRLLGKIGAHGDYSDIDTTITEDDANDAITFMRHYVEHVYVLPAKLAKKPDA